MGIEFILLTTFVLLNQKFQIRRGEQWAHLHLQLSILTEQEVTKNMQMLQHICRHLKIESLLDDREVHEMIQPTQVHALVGEIERTLDLESSTDAEREKILKLKEKLLRESGVQG